MFYLFVFSRFRSKSNILAKYYWARMIPLESAQNGKTGGEGRDFRIELNVSLIRQCRGRLSIPPNSIFVSAKMK